MADASTLNASTAQIDSNWKLLSTFDAVKVSQALQELAQHRPFIGRLTLHQAHLLVSKVQQYSEAWTEEGAHTAALLILARWCYTSFSVSAGDTATGSGHQELLKDAVKLTLPAGLHGKSPQLLAAAALFLSAAATVSSCEATRDSCVEALCDLLSSKGLLLRQSHLLTELIGAVGRQIGTQQQGSFGVLWLLALLLDLWTPHTAAQAEQENTIRPSWKFPHPAELANPASIEAVAGESGNSSTSRPENGSDGIHHVLDQMAALYGASRLIARAWLERNATSELQALTEVLESSLQSPDSEVQSGGILAVGGLLEGCLKGAKKTQAASSIAQQAERMLTASNQAAAQLQGNIADSEICLLQNATALSVVMAKQATGHPTVTPPMVQHQLHVLLDEALSLDGLFSAAAAGGPTAPANEWLRKQLGSQLMQHAAAFARSVALQYPQLDSAAQQASREDLRAALVRLHQAYSRYALCTPRNWLAQVDGNAVRQILDKVFMTVVMLLTAFWEAVARPVARHGQGVDGKKQALAAETIDLLAYLQFCRVRFAMSTTLLQETLTVAANSQEAALVLLSKLPCYADLVAPSSAADERPRWEVDAVLATVLQFRLSTLTPCVPRLPQVQVLETALPTTYLLMLHPHAPVVAASHSLFCAILNHVDEKQQLAPFYVRRALEGYPARTPLNALTTGMDALARSLPAGSPMILLCLQRIAAQCQQLLRTGREDELQPALDLIHLLGYLLLVMDIQALPEARDIVEKFVLASPEGLRQRVCSSLGKFLANSDDYVRKVQIVEWFQRLQAQI